MEHTPGPWTSDDGIIYPPDDCDGMVWIADCRAATNSQANIRLIEAAPDLLEAAQEAQCECSVHERMSGHRVGCWMPKLVLAISKATA